MKIKRFLSVLLTAVLAVGAFVLTASAEVKDTTKDVTLTIYALETEDGSEVTVDSSVTGEKITLQDKKPIPGVSFVLYKVADDETSTEIPVGASAVNTGLTGTDGSVTVVIPASAQGRYLVVENDKPSYAKGTTVPFLVDLPMTDPDGTGYLYEVYAYPKQLVEYDSDVPSDTELPPPESDSDIPSDTELPPPPESDSDTEPEPPTTDISTDEEVPNPKVSKEVSGDNGETWGDEANIAAVEGQKAYWKITAEIPDSIARYDIFTIGDILDKRLIAPEAKEVVASIEGKELPKSFYTVTVSEQTIKVDFKPELLAAYKTKSVNVIFPTAIDLDAEDSIGYKIENIATLTFTKLKDAADNNDDSDSDGSGKMTDTDDSSSDSDVETSTTTISTTVVEVWTGDIHGFKHDKDNKPLSGAEFTLYSDKECKNKIASATSDKKGIFEFKGLKDGTYYLKETKAPDGYQANEKVLEVKVEAQKDKAVTEIDVLNVPKSSLPLTGGAGIIGLSLIGIAVAVLGVFIIWLAVKVRKKALYAAA